MARLNRLVTILMVTAGAVALTTSGAVASPASLDPFEQTRVGDQPATAIVASFPTNEQVTEVVRNATCPTDAGCAASTTAFAQYVAYYGDRTTGGFTMRPGFVSGVGAEYAAERGAGSLIVSVSAYATSRQALGAATEIARGAGIDLRQVARVPAGSSAWGPYTVWTGTASAGDQGVIYAISGNRYARMWFYPPRKSWTPAQWRSTLQGFGRLLPQVMSAQQQFAAGPELEAVVPSMPATLIPVFFARQSKSAWLPYGKPDPALFEAMGPAQLSLQYAIAGAPETLALNASITPVADLRLAQELVDRLPQDPTAAGLEPIDGLPAGAQAVHYDDAGVVRLIYVQFVAKGALNELTCSDLSITSDLVTGRGACRAAIRDAAAAMSS